jgi:hypothetical protein
MLHPVDSSDTATRSTNLTVTGSECTRSRLSTFDRELAGQAEIIRTQPQGEDTWSCVDRVLSHIPLPWEDNIRERERLMKEALGERRCDLVAWCPCHNMPGSAARQARVMKQRHRRLA